MKFKPLAFFTLTLVLATACSPYRVREVSISEKTIPGAFFYQSRIETSEVASLYFWEEFSSAELNKLVIHALSSNPTLESARARLDASRALAVISGSARYPQLNGTGSAQRQRNTRDNFFGPTYNNQFSVGPALSFEVDIWRRLASAEKAADLRALATENALRQVALVLSGNVSELWAGIMGQNALLELLNKQRQANKRLLALTELRFSVGQGTALDVLQQRQQLAATEAQIPSVKAVRSELRNQLLALLGGGMDRSELVLGKVILDLPELRSSVSPRSILDSRPDLVEARFRAQAAEHEIARAVAERLPQLSLSFSVLFSAFAFDDLFDSTISALRGETLAPVFQGGAREAAVALEEARALEALSDFKAQYLSALEEIETLLSFERHQQELISARVREIKAATETLEESKSRYLNGQTDYLQVTIALRSLQTAERQLIQDKISLLTNRIRLYRSFGGVWEVEYLKEGKNEKRA